MNAHSRTRHESCMEDYFHAPSVSSKDDAVLLSVGSKYGISDDVSCNVDALASGVMWSGFWLRVASTEDCCATAALSGVVWFHASTWWLSNNIQAVVTNLIA